MSFAAKYPGRCGICRLRIRKGDRIEDIAPVVIELAAKHDYGMLRAPEPRYVTTRYAHAQCLGTENWSDSE